MVDRFEYGPEVIEWADAIITAGGDGTFLLGASKLRNVTKPLIGINTDPRRYYSSLEFFLGSTSIW
jgi:NAD+ kinase